MAFKTPIYQRIASKRYLDKLKEAGFVLYRVHVKPEHKIALNTLLEELKNFDSLPEVAKEQHLYQKGFIDKIAIIAVNYLQKGK